MRWIAAGLAALSIWLGGVAWWIAAGPEDDGKAQADVALVLGAAVIDDEPSPVFAARLDYAVELYAEGRVAGVLLTGGRSPEDRLSEGAAGKRYVSSAGVPREAIHIEEVSQTTLGNLREARRVMKRENIASVLIVSDPLHMRRAMAMAQSLGIEARPAPTPYTRYRSWKTRLPFLLRETYFLHHFWLFGQ